MTVVQFVRGYNSRANEWGDRSSTSKRRKEKELTTREPADKEVQNVEFPSYLEEMWPHTPGAVNMEGRNTIGWERKRGWVPRGREDINENKVMIPKTCNEKNCCRIIYKKWH
jgi:hypothetical protein